ncbi:MAG: hypothetical protein K0Q72_1077 [Armatimonadetes bacterium]|jgi:hypothetical protein|nr:hypothetical protein [Armatimonadota bacterium]
MTRPAAVLFAATALLSGWGVRAADTPPAVPAPKAPEGRTGPYRVVVDRISHNRKTVVSYRTDAAHGDPAPAQFARTVHLQLAVYTKEAWAGPGLAMFQVKGVSAETGARVMDLSHYGGMLETSADGAVLRAYLYLPNFPIGAKEIRAIEGDIVAYERSLPTEILIPVNGEKRPEPFEKDGVKVTVREWEVEGDEVQAVIWVEAPQNSVLINTTSDGTYGVSLLNTMGRAANTQGGALLQPRANQAEYRVGFTNLRGPIGTLRLRFLHRSGPRRIFPFQIERIPVPSRPGEPASPPAVKPGK